MKLLLACLLLAQVAGAQTNQEILKKERKRLNALSEPFGMAPMVRRVSVEGKEYLTPAFQCSHKWVELLDDTVVSEANFPDPTEPPSWENGGIGGGPYIQPDWEIPESYEYAGHTLICVECHSIRQQVIYYERARAYRKARDKKQQKHSPDNTPGK